MNDPAFLKEWESSFKAPFPSDYFHEKSRPINLIIQEFNKKSFWEAVKSKEHSALFWLARKIGIPEDKTIDFLELIARVRTGQIIYCRHERKKKNGKMRIIFEPPPNLKLVQSKINKRLFKNLLPRKENTHGFSGGNVPGALRLHLNSNFWVMIDIKNAFPSVRYKNIMKFFSQKKSTDLNQESIELNSHFSWYVTRMITQLCTHCSLLPQGTPTSSRLFDLLFYEIDEKLDNLSRQEGLVYSRYADNLFFSSKKSIPWRIRDEIFNLVTKETRSGLKLKWHKLRIIQDAKARDKAFRMLGLNLINGELRNNRKFQRKLRLLTHHIEWLIANNKDYFEERQQLAGMWGFAVKESLPKKLKEKIKNIFKNH